MIIQTITFVHINWDRCKGINSNNSTDFTTLLKHNHTAPPTIPSILEKGSGFLACSGFRRYSEIQLWLPGVPTRRRFTLSWRVDIDSDTEWVIKKRLCNVLFVQRREYFSPIENNKRIDWCFYNKKHWQGWTWKI